MFTLHKLCLLSFNHLFQALFAEYRTKLIYLILWLLPWTCFKVKIHLLWNMSWKRNKIVRKDIIPLHSCTFLPSFHLHVICENCLQFWQEYHKNEDREDLIQSVALSTTTYFFEVFSHLLASSMWRIEVAGIRKEEKTSFSYPLSIHLVKAISYFFIFRLIKLKIFYSWKVRKQDSSITKKITCENSFLPFIWIVRQGRWMDGRKDRTLIRQRSCSQLRLNLIRVTDL